MLVRLATFALLTASTLILTAPTANAQTYYWDSNGTTAGAGATPTGTWGTSNFWNDLSTGGAGTFKTATDNDDDLFFVAGPSGTSGNNAYTVTVNGDQVANSLNFQASGATTISGGTSITLGNGTAGSGGINIPQFAFGPTAQGTITIGTALVIANSQTWTNNSTNSIRFSGNQTLNNGGFNLTFSGNAATNLATSASNTLAISGTGGIIKNGTGPLILDSNPTIAHTFSGGITVNGGSVHFQTAANVTGRGNVTLNGGYLGGRYDSHATFAGGLGTGTNQIQILGGTSGFSGEGKNNSVFTIGSGGSVLKWGATGENGATGFFNPTVLLLGGNQLMNVDAKGSLNNAIDLNGTTRTITSLHANGNGASNTGFTVSGAISNSAGTAAGIIKTGPGNIIFNGANTYNGGTTINGGAITMGNASALGAAGTRNLTFTGNGRLNSTVTASLNVLTVNPGVTASFSNQNTTFTSTTGSGNIHYLGSNNAAGIINLGDASGFIGNLRNDIGGIGNLPTKTIAFSSLGDPVGSTMQFGGTDGNSQQSARYLFTSGSAPLIMTNRALEFLNPGATNAFDRAILQNDNASAANKWVIISNLINATNRAHSLELRGNNTGANEFAGSLGDSTTGTGNTLSLIKVDAGNWSLSNANNTFTGSITLGSSATGGNTQASSNGTLSYASAGGANPIIFNLTTGSATLSYIGSGQTMSGAISAATVTTGTVTLDASGTGAINYSNTGSLGAAGSGNKNLILSGTNTGNNILAGQWVNNTGGAATLTKNGVGKWVLSGINSYTGATNVNDGTLLVNGDQSSATGNVTVLSGATLGGSGIIGGATTVQATGIISPGGSDNLGTLTINGTTVLDDAIYNFELGTAGSDASANTGGSSPAIPHINHDVLRVNGTLSVDGLVVNLASAGSPGLIGSNSYSWLIATATDGISGTATVGSLGSDFTAYGGSFSLTTSGNNLFLNANPVPEPSTVLAMGAGFLGLCGLIRRRRKTVETVLDA